MSSTPSFTFSDLFAGIGGFHAALHAAGGTWAFASEIDADAAAVYDHNWLRPLRESGAQLPPGVESFRVSGDIVPLTDPEVTVPHADVLAAGFPCQPFSKSGYQRGMDETRGTLFWNIATILEDPERRPSVVMLENVRNLAGPRHRDTTFKTIVKTLRELGYRTASEPAVFSPHLLPRHLGGRPQVRERVFILAHYVGVEAAQDPANFDDPIVSPKSLDLDWRKDQWDLERDLPLQARRGGRRALRARRRRGEDDPDLGPTAHCRGRAPRTRRAPARVPDLGGRVALARGGERPDRRRGGQGQARSRPGRRTSCSRTPSSTTDTARCWTSTRCSSTPSRRRAGSSSGRPDLTARSPRRSCTSDPRASERSDPTTCRPSSPSPRPRSWATGDGSRRARQRGFRGSPTRSSSCKTVHLRLEARGAAGRRLLQADGQRRERRRRLLRLPRVRPSAPRRDPAWSRPRWSRPSWLRRRTRTSGSAALT